MKLNQLTEATSLKALGVPHEAVGRIHDRLKLKHDATYEPIRNKKLAAMAIKNEGRVIIAVNKEGETFAIGPWKHEFSGGYYVMFIPPGAYGSTETITDAFKAVSGPGWKYYVSTSSGASKSHSDRSEGYDYGHEFAAEVRKKFNEPIKQRAAEAHKTIRSHLMDLLDSEDEDSGTRGYTPSDRDMNQVKKVMKQMKNMADTGLDGYWDSWSRRGDRGAMNTFFDTGGMDYQLDYAIDEFKENNKLAVHKFVKFIYQQIQKQVDIYTTGGFADHSKKANDYDAERKAADNG